MKKLISILVVVLVLFIGCNAGYEAGYDRSVTVHTGYSDPEIIYASSLEEGMEVPNLAPIDESVVYLWDDQNMRAYNIADLADDGPLLPKPFLFEDGTVANIVAFEFYRPERAWYFKAQLEREVLEDGVVTGWETIYQMYKQKSGVVSLVEDGVPFPTHDTVKITEYEINGLVLFKTLEGWYAFMNPADTINSYISMPMKYIEYIFPVGGTLYMVSESPGYDHPQLHRIEGSYHTTRMTDYSKVVYKP